MAKHDGAIGMVARTLPDALERAVAADDTTMEEAAQIQALHDQSAAIEQPALEEFWALEASSKFTAEGKVGKHTEEAKKKLTAYAPIVAAINRAIAEDAELRERAPFMRREADGTYVDVRSDQTKLSDARLLMRELRDQGVWKFLSGLDEAPRNALLRGYADGEPDRDGVLDAALRAPGYMRLIDAATERHIVEARLRQNGLVDPLRRSAFKAGALLRLRERIERLLVDLGAPAVRPPLERLESDGTRTAISPTSSGGVR
jgi:hypothetical protein